ncbi:peroxiredoxin [Coprothermobacteraceae bacterium]|nr:peroxiredoxin [Coprothermobacteraceae bacterium]
MSNWLSLELQTAEGETLRLQDVPGWKVVYFYPRAMTSGCTTEAMEFTEAYPKFAEMGVEVIGVSPDDMATLRKFKEKVGIPFVLVSDPEHKLAEALDVWKEKNMYGRKTMGIERSTFIVSPDGQVIKEWRKVKAAGHAKAVLEAVKALIEQ